MKVRLTAFLLFSLCIYSQSVLAAFILNGTRYIFDENQKNISIEISNESKDTYGGQVWIDNVSLPREDVAFVPIPSFFKVDGGQVQIIRIIKTTNSLPKDKEAIFWLNVQEIPPVNKMKNNVMVIAVNTQVKLIYRPEGLIQGRPDAESKLVIVQNSTNDYFHLNNPTPYYFAITSLKVNGKKMKLTKELSKELSMVAPMSDISLQSLNIAPSSKITIEAIDDYGAINKYNVMIEQKKHNI